MAFADAVQAIVEQMEDDREEYIDTAAYSGQGVKNALLVYIRLLKCALKTNEGSPQQSVSAPPVDPQLFHLAQIEKAKEEFRRKRGDAMHDVSKEEVGFRSAECVGGGSEETVAIMDGRMPVGARMWVGGQQYELQKDGKLHYQPTDSIAPDA